MKNKIGQHASGQQVLITILLWIILSTAAGTGTYFAIQAWVPNRISADNLSITIVAEVYFLFLVAAFIVFGGLNGIRNKLNFKFTTVKDIWLVMKLYILLLAVVVIIYLILSPLIGSLRGTLLQVLRHASDMSRISSAGPDAWFLIIIRACILAPLTEELLFRGLLFGWLRSRFSKTITILLTTLLFTGMHFYPILFPIALLFGLGSGWIRERTGSSFNFVIAHVVNNLLFLAIAYLLVTKFGI
jgi:membrane protease YdiL (CAAX protease family)